MRPPSNEALESLLALRAPSFRYPRTPDLGAAVRARILAAKGGHAKPAVRAAALLAVLVLVILAAVPQARALVAGWFRIGIIQIEPAPLSATPSGSEVPVTATAFVELTETAADSLPSSLEGLTGITTLEEVQSHRATRVPLPQYPPDLGMPDVVVFQPEFDMLVLVWRDPSDANNASLALFEFMSNNPIVKKIAPTVIEETTVNASPALWVEGPYPLRISNGDYEWRRIVTGRGLLWEQGGVTYRLEANLSLDETRRIAESIR